MYTFLAHYVNVMTDAEVTHKIELEDWYDTEKDAAVDAMKDAYNYMKDSDLLLRFKSLEFISC